MTISAKNSWGGGEIKNSPSLRSYSHTGHGKQFIYKWSGSGSKQLILTIDFYGI